MESDTVAGPVVKTMRVLLFSSLGEVDDRLTTGLCPFRVSDRGKSEVRRRMEALRGREHLFIWVVLTGKDQQRIESHRLWWADSRQIDSSHRTRSARILNIDGSLACL